MGPGYSGVLEGASQTESSSKDPVITCTHNKDVEIDPAASQLGKSNQDNGPKADVPESWEDISEKVPPDTEPDSSKPLEKTTCVDSSNRDIAASFVSANNADTTPGYNDTLELSNKDGPPILNNVHDPSLISKSNESLEALQAWWQLSCHLWREAKEARLMWGQFPNLWWLLEADLVTVSFF